MWCRVALAAAVGVQESVRWQIKRSTSGKAAGHNSPTLFVIYLHYKGKQNKSKWRKSFFAAKKAINFLVNFHRKMKIIEIKWVNNLTGISIYRQEHKAFFDYLTKNKRKTSNGVLTKKQRDGIFYCGVSTRAFLPLSTNKMGGFRQNIKIAEKELNWQAPNIIM